MGRPAKTQATEPANEPQGKEHILTEQDLKENPVLVEQGFKVGDTVLIDDEPEAGAEPEPEPEKEPLRQEAPSEAELSKLNKEMVFDILNEMPIPERIEFITYLSNVYGAVEPVKNPQADININVDANEIYERVKEKLSGKYIKLDEIKERGLKLNKTEAMSLHSRISYVAQHGHEKREKIKI